MFNNHNNPFNNNSGNGYNLNQNNKRKKRKEFIPKSIKCAVWNTYVGHDKVYAYCYTGCGTIIHITTYECGHIKSEARGGKVTLKNLRPICGKCNQDMGPKNMVEFVKKYGLVSELIVDENKRLYIYDLKNRCRELEQNKKKAWEKYEELHKINNSDAQYYLEYVGEINELLSSFYRKIVHLNN